MHWWLWPSEKLLLEKGFINQCKDRFVKRCEKKKPSLLLLCLFSFVSGSGGKGEFSSKKEKDRKRNVAHEYGFDEDINEEYLFSPRQGKSRATMYDLSDDDDEAAFRFSMSESETDSGKMI